MDSDGIGKLGLSAILFGAATAGMLWLLSELRDPTSDVRLWLAYRLDDLRESVRGEAR